MRDLASFYHPLENHWQYHQVETGVGPIEYIVAPAKLSNEISLGLDGAGTVAMATGDVSSATTTSIDDSTRTGPTAWGTDNYIGEVLEITAGTAVGDVRVIVDNDGNTLTVNVPFTSTPDGTSDYKIHRRSKWVPVMTMASIGATSNNGFAGFGATQNDGTSVRVIGWNNGTVGAGSHLQESDLRIVGDVGGEIYLDIGGSTVNFTASAHGYYIHDGDGAACLPN